jgi:hypothetical protein
MWLSPRATVRWLIADRPGYLTHLLIAVALFSDMIRSATLGGLGDRLSLETILMIMGSVALPYMILYLYVFAWIVKWAGRLFGGRATVMEVRTALAWASVPLFASALLIIPKLLLFGVSMFRHDGLVASSATIAFGVMDVVLVVWWFVILIVAVAEAHQFALWKALISYLLSFATVILSIFGPVLYFASRP